MTSPLSPATLVFGFSLDGDPHISSEGTRVLYLQSKADPEKSTTAKSAIWIFGAHPGVLSADRPASAATGAQ